MIRSCLSDKNPSSSFVFVYLAMSWTGAQQYCRDHYTDLASVRNQTENDQMKKMTVLTYTWIGLYRDSWKWTDGSPLSFSNWVPGLAPTAAQTDTCAASDVGKWINLGCSVKFYFACFAGEPTPDPHSTNCMKLQQFNVHSVLKSNRFCDEEAAGAGGAEEPGFLCGHGGAEPRHPAEGDDVKRRPGVTVRLKHVNNE